jgi:hypothetical protein
MKHKYVVDIMDVIALDTQLQDVHMFQCVCVEDRADRTCVRLRQAIRRIVVPERPRGGAGMKTLSLSCASQAHKRCRGYVGDKSTRCGCDCHAKAPR